MSLELINKNKIRADDYISVLMVISFLLFALFFQLEAMIAIVVYPFGSLVIFGILKIVSGFNKKSNLGRGSSNKILLGIIAVIFAVLFLNFILVQPNVTSNVVITLIAFPIMIVGFAGIIKGSIIDLYKEKHRILNIIVGLITIVFCFFGFFSTANFFLFNIIALSTILLINILCRAALYLSEFGLSLRHIKNFRLFLYIISDYLIFVDRNGDLVLSKIE